MKDHYQTLGIKSDVSADELKASYRKLALKFHPDKNRGNLFSADRFQEIQEAYNILSNPEKRKMFDMIRNSSFYEETGHFQFEKNEGEENTLRNLEYTKTNITLIAVLIMAITFLAILLSI